MTLLAYTGDNVVLYNIYKYNNSKIIESSALSDEELLKLHSLTHKETLWQNLKCAL